MKPIKEILKTRKTEVNTKPKRKGNPFFGAACLIHEKLDLPLPMCFKLLKKHSPAELAPLVSWWKDYPYKKQNNIGLLYWKLKQLCPEKYVKK